MSNKALAEEASNVLSEVRGFTVEAIEKIGVGGLETIILDLGLVGGARAVVVVLPPRTQLNLKNSRRALAAGLEALEAGGREARFAIIIYSRGGRVTMPAYLYLGLAGSRLGGEIVIVNGPPGEVREVLRALKAFGRVYVREDRVYPAKIL